MACRLKTVGQAELLSTDYPAIRPSRPEPVEEKALMVTNYPQQLMAGRMGRELGASRLLSRTVTRVRQMLCGLGGHDALLHFEGRRVMMRCASCGHDTPGWETGERAPRRRYEGDPRRHALPASPRLVLRKSA